MASALVKDGPELARVCTWNGGVLLANAKTIFSMQAWRKMRGVHDSVAAVVARSSVALPPIECQILQHKKHLKEKPGHEHTVHHIQPTFRVRTFHSGSLSTSKLRKAVRSWEGGGKLREDFDCRG